MPVQTSPTLPEQLAKGLGWFSLALGAAGIAAPGAIAKTLGIQGKERLLQGYGAREVFGRRGRIVEQARTRDLGTCVWRCARSGDNTQRSVGRGSQSTAQRGDCIAAVAAVGIFDAVVAGMLRKQNNGTKGSWPKDVWVGAAA